MKIVRCLAMLSAMLPVFAFAQATPGVDQHQLNQQHRIEQGEASGRLTDRETNRLERGQQHVQNAEDRARADGVVTARERARLHNMQERQSARIYDQKHDRQHDYNHNGRVDRPHFRR